MEYKYRKLSISEFDNQPFLGKSASLGIFSIKTLNNYESVFHSLNFLHIVSVAYDFLHIFINNSMVSFNDKFSFPIYFYIFLRDSMSLSVWFVVFKYISITSLY